MTKEDILTASMYLQNIADVLDAAAEGKSVQMCKIKKWEDVDLLDDSASFDFTIPAFRLKPEPTYKPYSAETFFKDAVKHNFTIKHKLTSTHMHIDVWNDGGWVSPTTRNTYFWSLMLREWVWADDGSPTGILTNNE